MGIQKWLSVRMAVASERSAIKRSAGVLTGSDYPTIADLDGGRCRRPTRDSGQNHSEETALVAFPASISTTVSAAPAAPVRLARLRPALPRRFSFRP